MDVWTDYRDPHMKIPKQLKKAYFVKCLKKSKKPFEKGWQNKRIKYPEIEIHTKEGGNYGVLCGVEGLLVVDFDNKEFYEDQNQFFPDTFEVKTPSKGYHKYYYCHDLDGGAIIKNPDTGEQVGELRYNKQQAIGAGSIHPDTGTPYKVCNDTDIVEIEAKVLVALLGKYTVDFNKDKDEIDNNIDCGAEIFPLIHKMNLKHVGNEWQGSHPIHGSSTGNNFCVNVEKNVWHCFRHNHGGNAVHLTAIMEGIIKCEDIHKLKGRKYKEAVAIAKEKYGINIKEVNKEKSLVLAEKFLEDNKIIYSEENNTFYKYLDNYYQSISEIDLNKIFLEMDGWQSLSINRINDVIKRIKVLNGKHIHELNPDNYINLENGVFDLINYELLPHNEDYFHTIRLPYKYDENAKCDEWLKFLKQSLITEERIETLQEYLGYCVTKETKFEMALCMTGEGRNGKGVITYVLQKLVGEENVSDLGLEYFGDTQMIRVLVNKLVNISEEVRENAVNFDAEFKKITSGEPITVNQKYVDIYKFRPFCKLIMNINNFPRITDKTRAFYERLLIIPFERTFDAKQRDSNLKKRLVDNELSGILNWVIEGQKRLFNRGNFNVTKEMKLFLNELKKTNNPVESFIEEELIYVDGNKMYKEDIYSEYTNWCKDTGHKPLSSNNLFKSIYKQYSIKPDPTWRDPTSSRRRYIIGVKLLKDHPVDYNDEEVQWDD